MGLYLPPSYKDGYAHGPDESAYPELWKGLVGLWLPGMRGRNGTDGVKDFSGKGNHGTTNGSMTADDWVVAKKPNGQVGHALDFDGDNHYVSLGTNNIFELTSRLSISAWIKHDVTGVYEGIVQKGTDGIFGMYEIHVNNTDKFTFIINNDSANQANSVTTIGTTSWYHVAATWDKDISSGLMTVYVNGIAEGTDTFASALTAQSTDLRIGRYSSSLEWNGLIDDVRIYNRALSADEIKQIYLGASPLTLKAPRYFMKVGEDAVVGNVKNLLLLGVG